MEGRCIDAWVERAVLERIDLLIIDKFGREEARNCLDVGPQTFD